MRKFYSTAVLAILLSVLSSPVIAAVEDCEVLKGDGGPRGLYGMCVAYWNHEANQGNNGSQLRSASGNNRFLDKYNAIRDRVGGPPMPGLDDSPEMECACWSYLTVDQALKGVYVANKGGLPGIFELLFFDDENLEPLRDFGYGSIDNSCVHMNSSPAIKMKAGGLTDEELWTCQAELQELADLAAD